MAIQTINTNDNGSASLIKINDNFTDLDTTKADLASPTFTGTPVLPTGTTGVTQSASDNSTKLATTAYVDNQISTASIILSTTVNISSAQIKALFSSPVTLITGVAGQIVDLISVVAVFNYGTVQYTAGGATRIKEETTGTLYSSTQVLSATQINGTADVVVTQIGRGSTNALVSTPGKGILLNAETQNFATGDGTIDVHLLYRMVTV